MGVNAHKRVFIPIHKGLDGFIMDASTAPDDAKPYSTETRTAEKLPSFAVPLTFSGI